MLKRWRIRLNHTRHENQALAVACSVLFAVATALLPQTAAAVTTAECLQQSHDPTAVRNCQALLDDGTRSVSIYLRLAEALNATGQRAESYQKIEAGLKRYPGNAELADLKAIVRSNLTEQEFVDAQQRKGPSAQATNKAKLRVLRIKCLKMDAQEALDACEEFVALGGGDGEIDQRYQSLQASLAPAPAPAPPEPEKSVKVIELTPAPAPAPAPSPTPEPQQPSNTQSDKDREAYQRQIALVKDIQTTLNALGFPAGTPDGLSGSKTRNAIGDFYAATRIGPAKGIGQLLLEDLRRAEQLREDAQVLHSESRRALANGDAQNARELLESAQQLASWVAPAADLTRRIDNALADQQAQSRQFAEQQRARELLTSATAAIDNGQLEDAAQLLNQAERIPSVDSAAERARLAEAIAARDRLAQQQAAARERQLQAERANERAKSLLGQARTALANDNLDRATALTQQARQAAPELNETNILVAEIASRQREIDAENAQRARTAAAEASKAKQLATVAKLLGSARNELNADNRTAARAIAEEVLALQPDNADALSIIKSSERQSGGQPQQRLAELLARGQSLMEARQNRVDGQPDYFTDTLPASIGKLFE